MALPETSSLENSLARILGQPATPATPSASLAPVAGPTYGGLSSPGATTTSLGAEQPYTDPATAAAAPVAVAPVEAAAPTFTASEASPFRTVYNQNTGQVQVGAQGNPSQLIAVNSSNVSDPWISAVLASNANSLDKQTQSMAPGAYSNPAVSQSMKYNTAAANAYRGLAPK